jgi:hydroxypyruvate isomerase
MSEDRPTSAQDVSRRGLLSGSVAALVAGVASRAVYAQAEGPAVTKGRINQSVCAWSAKIPMNQLAPLCKQLGLKGVDLVGKGDFALLKEHGLVGTMLGSHGIGKGFNRKENHAECAAAVKKSIDVAAEAGFPNVICFSGNYWIPPVKDDPAKTARDRLDQEAEGLANCVEGLKLVLPYAEEKKVNVIMELLNDKRGHKNYMCHRTAWGAKLVRTLASERFKLLYDIYHMQIDEGDVIDTIKEFKDCIGHYHTAGVPGRSNLDEDQELNYPAIMRTIANTGFKGYVAHEFSPKGDPIKALTAAVKLCDV